MARSNFPFVLALGLLILAALFLFQTESAPEPKKYIKFREPGGYETGVEVGTFGTEVKHIPLSPEFSVGSSEPAILFRLKNATVSRGVFSGSDIVAGFRAGNVSDLILEVNVSATNLYGDLRVDINGENVLSSLIPPGSRTVKLNTSVLRAENYIRVYAESSGWRLWAPTVYIFNLTLIGFTRTEERNFTVSLNRPETVAGARIVFFAEGDGNLSVRVNGETVFFSAVSGSRFIDFDPEILRKENIIEFGTDGRYSVKNAELILFFYPPPRKSVFWYNLTSSGYSNLLRKNVSVEFTVERLVGDVKSVWLEVKNSAGKKKILIQGVIREGGRYSVILTRNELREGSNRITIGSDGGFVKISDLNFRLVG